MLYVIDDYNSTSQTFVRREVDQLLEQGVDVAVFSLHPSAPPTASFEVSPATPRAMARSALTLLSSRRGRSVLGEAVRSGRGDRRRLMGQLFAALVAGHLLRVAPRPDHIHAHFFGRCADIAFFLGRLTEIPYSATGHATEVLAPADAQVLKRNVLSAGGLVGESDLIRDRLIGLVPSGEMPAISVHSGLPRSVVESSQAKAELNGDFRVLTVARLVPKKGFDAILRAGQRLRADGFKFRWAIVGEGPLRETLEREIPTAELSAQIQLLGAKSNAETLGLVREADVFVLPCVRLADGETDGLPASLIEAVALGTPVVTTAVGAIPELVKHGETGLMVPERDGDAVAEAIVRLQRDRRLYSRLAENGRREALKNYVLEDEVARLRQFFAVCASSNRPSARTAVES